MPERSKGKTLVARDEGDDADGVVIKLYGEETNGAISIIEQPFEPGFSYRHTCTRTMSGSTCSRGRCTPGSARRPSRPHPAAGC
jgi:hypothetical protein